LADPINIPIGVIAYMASQLTIADLRCIVRYGERLQTQQEHTQEIRQHSGYTEFAERRGGFALMRFLYARVWVGTERPSVLFDLVNVPTSRIKALAHYAVTTKAQSIAKLTEQRRTATLVSFTRQLSVTAQDDSLDVLDMLMRDLLARSTSDGKKARLRTLRDLDAAALSLAEISEKVITPEWTDDQVRAFLTEKQAKITEAVATIYKLARPADDNYYQEI